MTKHDATCDPLAAMRPGVLTAKWDGHSTFTVDEAAEILGLSRWAAYMAAKNREIPTIRIGRRLIVPRMALERLLGA
jgi:excisionase family DNA binding protein